jgi:hypothetical protein
VAETSEATIEFALGDLDRDLTVLVKTVLAPLFELFDFFQLGDDVYEDIVDRFVRGEVS